MHDDQSSPLFTLRTPEYKKGLKPLDAAGCEMQQRFKSSGANARMTKDNWIVLKWVKNVKTLFVSATPVKNISILFVWRNINLGRDQDYNNWTNPDHDYEWNEFKFRVIMLLVLYFRKKASCIIKWGITASIQNIQKLEDKLICCVSWFIIR